LKNFTKFFLTGGVSESMLRGKENAMKTMGKPRKKPRLAAVAKTIHPVTALRTELAMPRATFARLVGRTERAVIDWESGKSKLQGLSEQRLNELRRLTDALSTLFRPDTLAKWFNTPNSAFGGLKPLEVIERGESDRLWQMVFELRAGTHV